MTVLQDHLCSDPTEGFYSQTHTQPSCFPIVMWQDAKYHTWLLDGRCYL